MLRYLINNNVDEGNKQSNTSAHSSPLTSTSNTTTMTNPQPKTVKMWACDYCQTTFRNFDDACRCEDQCRLRHNNNNINEDNNNSDAPASQAWSCNVCQKQFADYDEACRHEESCGQTQYAARTGVAGELTNDQASEPSHSSSIKEKTGRPKSNKRSEQSEPMNATSTESSSKKRKAARNKRSEPTKRSRSTANRGKTTSETQAGTCKKRSSRKQATLAPVADIFLANKRGGGTAAADMQTLMAENNAAEFAAKRRKQAEQERERQKRRQETKLQIQAAKKTSSSEAHGLMKSTSSLIPFDVRFPVPSHVTTSRQVRDSKALEQTSSSPLPSLDSIGSCWIDHDSLSKAQRRLGKTPRYRGSIEFANVVHDDCTGGLLPKVATHSTTSTTMVNPLQEALAHVLLVPLETQSDGNTCGDIWCDKYVIRTIPDDVCGAQNKETARELVTFVNEWKVERHRAHERRAERQRALQRSKKKKRRTKHTYDDLWDDYSDDEDGGLCSVCLLTGPCGSGKTALVHAVARESDCKVLEINTTERRGGQALKRAIEEATQSDSSLDMLKKTQITSDTASEALVDSDDETEEMENKGSSIVIVLIDEVDVIFEDAGDSGFWSALSTLTKKAKCPIFLTANFVPESLVSSTIRYLHVESVSPEPHECASKMLQIVQSEGLRLTDCFADHSAAKKQLSRIALLCDCDLRRIINELQLFTASPPLSTKNDDSPMQDDYSTNTPASLPREPLVPIIFDIAPKEVSPHDFTLLSIKGDHFSIPSTSSCTETSLQVFVGDQICPAVQILDDKSILAVCPPCSVVNGVADSGDIEHTGRESRTARFVPVSIRVFVREDILSRSDANVTCTVQLVDGTPSTFLGRKWNVEYAFPPPRYGLFTNREVGSEMESSDNDDESNGKIVSEAAMATTRCRRPLTKEEASLIIEKGVRDLNAKHSESCTSKEETEMTCRTEIMRDVESAQELLALSSLSDLSSDAAVFEDACEFGGLPFLAGVVPGFGSSLVNDTGNSSEGNKRKILRDANARPPSFERLFSLGWNDEGCFFGSCDTFMQDPTSTSERKLLARSQSLERGLSHAFQSLTASSDAYHDGDEDGHHDDDNNHASESLVDTIKLHERHRRVSEEDAFIRPHHPSPLHSLPNDLRLHVRDAGLNLIEEIELNCLPNALKKKVDRLVGAFSDLLGEEDDPKNSRLLCDIARLNESSIVPLSNRMEGHMFLDYLPMLCNIAMHERAAEHAFQQLRVSDPESAATAATAGGRHRRSTRRSAKSLERGHYFVSTRSCGENSVANEIGSKLAREVLHYSKERHTP